MNKKLLAAALMAATAVVSISAYNPPAGGQNLFRLTEPALLTGAGSAAGGALFSVTPASVVNNPALTAYEQRVVLDVAGTMLFDSSDDDHSVGGAFETGVLIPSKWCVSSVLLQGIFVPFDNMQLGNSFTLTSAFSKDITDNFSVGAGVNLGVFYGYNTDWLGGVSFGCLYNVGNIAFLRNVRFGGALLNLGKSYTGTSVTGITGSEADSWPGVVTPRIGAAGTLFSAGKMDFGASLDISTPSFQDFVLDTGLQMMFGGFVKLSTAWEFDAREFSNDSKNILPSVGLSFKFLLNSKDGSLLAQRGWQQSEMTVSGAWQHLYKNVDAVSTGMVLDLGLKDTQAPEITLWGEN